MEVEVPVPAEVHPDGHVVLADNRWCEYESQLGAMGAADPNRLVYAAAHVVMRNEYSGVEHSAQSPGRPDEIVEHVDWEGTMSLRRELSSHGFAIAEAMDTAQRFSLGWAGARQLIEKCGALRLPHGFVAGASTDHLESVKDPGALVDGVVFQADWIRRAGGEVILLPMQELVEWRADPETYVSVYRDILAQIEGPVFVHWLGEMFHPALAGYFPGDSFLDVMRIDPDKVRGAKLSMLDADLEVRLRAELQVQGQIMLTGDDYHFASMIAGPERGPETGPETGTEKRAAASGSTTIGERSVATGDFSHALLGIFDAIYRPAALALQFLARDRRAEYQEIMAACEQLSRTAFAEPTRFYKTGLAFLSWLDGQQENRMLVNHEETARDAAHLVRCADLASRAGVLRDAESSAQRLVEFLAQSVHDS